MFVLSTTVSLVLCQSGVRERRKEEQDDGSSKPHLSAAVKQQKAARSPRIADRGGGKARGGGGSGGGGGRMPVHCVVLPALVLGAVAMVVYLGEMWWAGSGVNKPLPLPPAVSEVWRNESVYLTRLWGTYR